MEMIIVCKFHDPSIIGSRDTEGGGGVRGAPPRSQIDQKKPSLNRVKVRALLENFRISSIEDNFHISLILSYIVLKCARIHKITYSYFEISVSLGEILHELDMTCIEYS